MNRNIKWILNCNEELKRDCQKYHFPLFNTSRGEKRDIVIANIINCLIDNQSCGDQNE